MFNVLRAALLAGLSLLFSSSESRAQRAREAYRADPLTWHNRKPHAAYWQQDVHYTIAARIDETEHSITGTEELVYVNNSPDTLREVFFHLYQNAFIAQSYLRDLERGNNVKQRLGAREAAGLGIGIEEMKVDGATPALELDNTILKVTLPRPLLPGASARFAMRFKTWYDRGTTRRRMQMYPAWGFMHYNGCQWYPKMCVYDAHSGWNIDQHLGKEFYGDFGTFDVKLDFPSNYVVEATGVLQNRKEVLPDALRARLDMKNFAGKKWNDTPSTVTPYVRGERKVWHYTGQNVHDFAFTADPSYRIATAYWNGVECVGIAQEPHAAGWQNSAQLVARIVQMFSEDIGQYAYPKMVAADANDGMEYPMITMDGGADPGYRGLLVHEIGHNWFYGMVGSNETYRAALDEGFTQFLTGWGMRKIDGDTVRAPRPKGWYRRHFRQPAQRTIDQRVINAYLQGAQNLEELPLETHSDDFHSALGHDGGYRQVYYKTATMLYNLQYLLGDSLFQGAMRHYFSKWKLAHPYFEDFRESIIEYTGQNLNPFFDQWLVTTKRVDYGIARVQQDGDSARITFRRHGESVMPITFSTVGKDGARTQHTVPVQWQSERTMRGTLPRWTGWGAMNKTHTVTVPAPDGLRLVEIDTTRRLADVYQLNNVRAPGLFRISPAVELRTDGGTYAAPYNPHAYRLWWRPDVWWNPVDGIKAGLHVEGDYARIFHRLDATVWWNTHVLQYDRYLVFENEPYYLRHAPVNYSVSYSTPVLRSAPRLRVELSSRFLDGLNRHEGGLRWTPTAGNVVTASFLTMWRPVFPYDLDYLIYPQEWSSTAGRPNASLNAAWLHIADYRRGTGFYRFGVRAPLFAGRGADAFDYGFVDLDATNYNRLGKLELRTRLYARWGTGNRIPQESALWLAGANPEALMENKYTRSIGIVPESWQGISRFGTNHFQQGGGLNLRGYAGYFVADERGGEVLVGYKGRSGVGGSVEADVDGFINLRPKFTRAWLHLDVYAFADAGIIELQRFASTAEIWNTTPTNFYSDFRADAGLGIAATIKKWGPFEKARPLTLRIDFPLLLNRPPFEDPRYAALRWVVGVNRSF